MKYGRLAEGLTVEGIDESVTDNEFRLSSEGKWISLSPFCTGKFYPSTN